MLPLAVTLQIPADLPYSTIGEQIWQDSPAIPSDVYDTSCRSASKYVHRNFDSGQGTMTSLRLCHTAPLNPESQSRSSPDLHTGHGHQVLQILNLGCHSQFQLLFHAAECTRAPLSDQHRIISSRSMALMEFFAWANAW